MADLIDHDALMNLLNFYTDETVSAIIADVEAIPTIDAVSVVHAWWINTGEEDEEGSGNFRFICSNCSHSDIHSKAVDVNFCWNCGADMRGGKNERDF